MVPTAGLDKLLEWNVPFCYADGMTTWTVLTESHQALRTAVRGVPTDGWTRPTPCAKWNVAQVLQHAVGDQIAYAAFITGQPGPSFDPFSPSGELEGDPVALAEEAMDASAAAWATIAADRTDAPTPLPQGALPAWVGAGACGLDAAVHAWDIAVATGQPSPLTPALAAELLKVAQEIVEPLRQYGAYAAVLAPTAGDDEVAALLRYLGRDPHAAL